MWEKGRGPGPGKSANQSQVIETDERGQIQPVDKERAQQVTHTDPAERLRENSEAKKDT
jgi:hypothetical protein